MSAVVRSAPEGRTHMLANVIGSRTLGCALCTALLTACGPEASNNVSESRAVQVSVVASDATSVEVVAGTEATALAPTPEGDYAGTVWVPSGTSVVEIRAYAVAEGSGPELVADQALSIDASATALYTRASQTPTIIHWLTLASAKPPAGTWIGYEFQATNPDGSPGWAQWWSATCEASIAPSTDTRGRILFTRPGPCHMVLWSFGPGIAYEEFAFTVQVVPE